MIAAAARKVIGLSQLGASANIGNTTDTKPDRLGHG